MDRGVRPCDPRTLEPLRRTISRGASICIEVSFTAHALAPAGHMRSECASGGHDQHRGWSQDGSKNTCRKQRVAIRGFFPPSLSRVMDRRTHGGIWSHAWKSLFPIRKSKIPTRKWLFLGLCSRRPEVTPSVGPHLSVACRILTRSEPESSLRWKQKF
jgi:hypothetical protein